MRKFCLLFILISAITISAVKAQIGVGEWRDHLPYTYPVDLTSSADKIFVASENGIFSYHKSANNIEKLTKVNILSDIGITAIEYYSNYNVLIVGYSNGNLDLIFNNQKYNIPDIKREMILGSKSINHIRGIGQYAYLSCGFGIVLVDLEKKEIKDTYYIGNLGTQLNVNCIYNYNNYLYAATSQGVYVADINNPNLIDYANWGQIVSLPNPFGSYNHIVVNEQGILVNQNNDSGNDIIYLYKDGLWNIFNNEYGSVKNIVSDGNIHIVTNRNILNYSASYNFQDSLSVAEISYLNPVDVIVENNIYWIANRGSGLLRHNGANTEVIIPNAPFTANAFYVETSKNRVLVAPGGVSSAWNNTFLNSAIFSFRNEQWKSFYNYNAVDYIVIKVDPQNPEHYYAGSWGMGVVEYHNDQIIETYNPENSTLQSIIPGGDFCRIGGMAFDRENNLWVTNYNVAKPISVKTTSGEWHGFNFGETITGAAVAEIVVDENDNKWVVLLDGNGLFVFNNDQVIDNEDDYTYKKFNIVDENGKIISNNIHSIALDLTGDIWVGTDQGVVVYYTPENVFETDLFYAQRVKLTIGDGTNYLLHNDVVTSIAVDGANRKWLGTQSSGVFLVSKDGTEEINHFTAENSPLLSDRISHIGINHETGEVFFATDKGLVSYRGSATMGSDEFRDVYVYPNPVREGYSGNITVRGLVSDVNVKITDISGNIVYETTAEGGQAVWDGKNFDGRKVSTGVYLVFCTNDDGSKTYVTKLLFIK